MLPDRPEHAKGPAMAVAGKMRKPGLSARAVLHFYEVS
jgi:hypothetical protein